MILVEVNSSFGAFLQKPTRAVSEQLAPAGGSGAGSAARGTDAGGSPGRLRAAKPRLAVAGTWESQGWMAVTRSEGCSFPCSQHSPGGRGLLALQPRRTAFLVRI